MAIEYDHALNRHTFEGALEGLSSALRSIHPNSLLDVGCGSGTWLRAAMELGIEDVVGLDGVSVPGNLLQVPADRIGLRDLSRPFCLGRRFDVALCLEVGEHLPEACAADLIGSIAAHTDLVLFSAACPGQPGQCHINCQWPDYWQGHFNSMGFVCDDSIRWQIWSDDDIEPWYRQNMFWAKRDTSQAGQEERLKAVVHPAIVELIVGCAVDRFAQLIESGARPSMWYFKIGARRMLRRAVRHFRSSS